MAQAQPLLNQLDLDDVLGKFKVYGRYHAVSCVYLIMRMAFNVMWYINYVFLIEKVGYRCADNSSGPINISITRHSTPTTEAWCRKPASCVEWVYDNPDSFVAEFQLACQDWKRTLVGGVHNIGYMAGVLIIGSSADRCADNSSGPINISNTRHKTAESWCRNPGSCVEWVYDNPDSFVAEFQLACQDWKRTLVGGAHTFGYMAGLLIIGPSADRFGRKPMIVITGVAAGVLGLAKSFATSYWLYVVLELLEAAIGDSISPLFTLAIEMVSTKSRVTYITICNVGLGGGTLLALMAWLIPYWRTLVRVLYAPGLLSILLIYLLDESPRWLLSKGRKKEAVEILRNAAKQNKINIEENLDMISYEKDEGSSFISAIRDTIKSRRLLKRFTSCTIWWTASTFVGNGILVNSVSLAGNKYVNYALSIGTKFPSSILSAYIVTKLNRRSSLILFFVVCAVLCVGQPFIPKNLIWLSVLTYIAGKLASSMCLNVIYIFTSELFPTHTRNSMHALCSSVGRIGSIMATQTPLLVVYWSGLPTMMFGAASLIAGLATLFVPETGDLNLPDTVGQAEALEDFDRVKN